MNVRDLIAILLRAPQEADVQVWWADGCYSDSLRILAEDNAYPLVAIDVDKRDPIPSGMKELK